MISTLTQQQNEMSNDTYHEKFNTKMRTAVNFDHEIIWKYEAKTDGFQIPTDSVRRT
jgi:hypothetical protein